MIKLIVADMDGCLLDPGEKLPINFREAYDLMTILIGIPCIHQSELCFFQR